MVAMKGRVPAFVGLLIAMLARSSLPGARAAVVKVVTDAAAADPTVHFTSSPAYGSPPPSFDIVRSNSDGSLQLRQAGGPSESGSPHALLTAANKTVTVDEDLVVKGRCTCATDKDDPSRAGETVDVALQLRMLADKVASLEGAVQDLEAAAANGGVAGARPDAAASACSEISSSIWAGAGPYMVNVTGVMTQVYCDAGKWTLVMRGTNPGGNLNSDPGAYPQYPVGRPPASEADLNAHGVFRYPMPTINAMRGARKVNDIRLRGRKATANSIGLTDMGDAYFPKSCDLDFDRQPMLPSGHACYKSGTSPDVASYDYTGGHQDRYLGRWPGSHVSGNTGWSRVNFLMYAVHLYPQSSVTGEPYCTWSDTRDCTTHTEVSTWIY